MVRCRHASTRDERARRRDPDHRSGVGLRAARRLFRRRDRWAQKLCPGRFTDTCTGLGEWSSRRGRRSACAHSRSDGEGRDDRSIDRHRVVHAFTRTRQRLAAAVRADRRDPWRPFAQPDAVRVPDPLAESAQSGQVGDRSTHGQGGGCRLLRGQRRHDHASGCDPDRRAGAGPRHRLVVPVTGPPHHLGSDAAVARHRSQPCGPV